MRLTNNVANGSPNDQLVVYVPTENELTNRNTSVIRITNDAIPSIHHRHDIEHSSGRLCSIALSLYFDYVFTELYTYVREERHQIREILMGVQVSY